MPFESLSCTNCGSGSVQEVKPNTYFCDHCERVFKYVEPDASKVNSRLDQERPCGCGSGYPVSRVQCQVCRGSVCAGCEVSNYTRLGAGDHRLFIIPAPPDGFGYLMDFPTPWVNEGLSGSMLWSITSDRSTQVTEGGRIGPFLYINDVVSQVAASLGRAHYELHTLCRSCALAAVPAAAK
jgi:hypothetical protein